VAGGGEGLGDGAEAAEFSAPKHQLVAAQRRSALLHRRGLELHLGTTTTTHKATRAEKAS
jgi:hypothetical protein